MIKIKKYLVASLLMLMFLSPVFAADTSTDDHITNINYEVAESYKWSAPSDFVFTTNVDAEIKTGTVSVMENIVAGGSTLKISIGPDEVFKLTSNEGSTRDYKLLKGSNELSAGSEVLAVPSGINEATQDLNFALQGVVSGNISQVAGTFRGTLNFVANIETVGSGSGSGGESGGGSGHLEGTIGTDEDGNPVFYTTKVGTFRMEFIALNNEQSAGGFFPPSYSLNYEFYSFYFKQNDETGQYEKIEEGWADSGKPKTNDSTSGEYEHLDIGITQEMINQYNGKIPCSFNIRAPMYNSIPINKIAQFYWFRYWFEDLEGNKELIYWEHYGARDENKYSVKVEATKEEALAVRTDFSRQ